jgi:hypothetical protein
MFPVLMSADMVPETLRVLHLAQIACKKAMCGTGWLSRAMKSKSLCWQF